jgi:ABC-2 type transport system permease protein
MLQIFRKEINSFFSSLVAYVVVTVFLVVTGMFVWFFPGSNVFESGVAQIDTLFGLAPYIFMFLIPAVTMRSFAEEKKAGTMELLLTRPLGDWDIIIGKYLAGWTLVIFALVPTLLYYYTVYQLGMPVGNIDTAAVTGSYIGLVMLAGVYTSVGVFSSSITDNQIVAFIIAVFFCYVLYDGFASVSKINVWSSYSYYINQLGIGYHYSSISRGLLDSRNLVYFASLIVVMLSFTRLVLGSRKW